MPRKQITTVHGLHSEALLPGLLWTIWQQTFSCLHVSAAAWQSCKKAAMLFSPGELGEHSEVWP